MVLGAFFTVGLCAAYADKNLSVAWDPSPDSDVLQYRLYYGEVGGLVTNRVAVKATTGTIPGVLLGKTYFAYATALTSAGAESLPSESVFYSPTLQLTAIPNQKAIAGSPFSLQLTVADPGFSSGSYSYSLVSGPAGASVSAGGLLTWTPAQSQASATYDVTVGVSAIAAPAIADTKTFQVTVAPVGSVSTPNTSPRLTSVGGQMFASVSMTESQVLENGGFESGHAGWNTSGNEILKTSLPAEATDGACAIRFNSGQTDPTGVLSRCLATTSGLTYHLHFDAGIVAHNQNEQRLRVTVQGASELVAQTVSMTGNGTGTLVWESRSYTFVADSSTATLTFQDVSPATVNLDMLLDNVRIIQETPAMVVLTATPGVNLNAWLTAADGEANALTYTLVSGPTGASVSPTGLFNWTPMAGHASSTSSVTVRVSDNGVPSLSDAKTFQVAVGAAVNHAPTMLPIAPQTITVGSELVVGIQATDSDLPLSSLTFALVSGPAGASIDPATGVLRWKPGLAHAESTTTISVLVQDAGTPPLTDTTSFTVYVPAPNVAPILSAIQNQLVVQGEDVVLTLSATDADSLPGTLTYRLVSGPVGATVSSSSGEFRWTPTTAVAPGFDSVEVQVTDAGVPPLSDRKTFLILVTAANTAPVLSAIPNQSVSVGAGLLVSLSANDADLPAQSLTYSLVSGPAGATVSAAGVFSWTPATASTNTVTVQVADSGAPSKSDRKSFVVVATKSNTAPALATIVDQKVSPGQLLMVALAGSDPDGPRSALTYRLVTGPAGAVVDPVTGIFTWRLAKSAPTEIYHVTVSVTDRGTPPLTDTRSFRVIVSGKGSRGTQNEGSESNLLSWVADLGAERTISFEHALGAQKQSGEWVHYLEASEDLVHWVTVGPLSSASQLRDTASRESSIRFYRVRSEAGGSSSASATAAELAALE